MLPHIWLCFFRNCPCTYGSIVSLSLSTRSLIKLRLSQYSALRPPFESSSGTSSCTCQMSATLCPGLSHKNSDEYNECNDRATAVLWRVLKYLHVIIMINWSKRPSRGDAQKPQLLPLPLRMQNVFVDPNTKQQGGYQGCLLGLHQSSTLAYSGDMPFKSFATHLSKQICC